MKKNKGFTLIELMIALALIAILSAVAVGVYRSYVKNAAKSSLQADVRNCITCVTAELAESALTGATPDFTNCTTQISKYTQSCTVSNIGGDEYECSCSGKGIISDVTCIAYTNSSELSGTNCE